MKSLAFVCFLFLLAGCSSQKTCRYEKEYTATSDSLKKYPVPMAAFVEIPGNSTLSDLTQLSCADYMKKYKLNDQQLKTVLETAEVSWSIGKTFQSIEENIRLSDALEMQRAEELLHQLEDSTGYSVHPEEMEKP